MDTEKEPGGCEGGIDTGYREAMVWARTEDRKAYLVSWHLARHELGRAMLATPLWL